MRSKRLIVMDDEPDFCDFVAEVAEGIGFETAKVTDSRRFKETYKSFEPEAIVIDMVMPDLDGFDLVQWLIEQKTEAKILIVTGYNPLYAKSAQLQSVAKGLGQVKTFTKPVSISKLRAALS